MEEAEEEVEEVEEEVEEVRFNNPMSNNVSIWQPLS